MFPIANDIRIEYTEFLYEFCMNVIFELCDNVRQVCMRSDRTPNKPHFSKHLSQAMQKTINLICHSN